MFTILTSPADALRAILARMRGVPSASDAPDPRVAFTVTEADGQVLQALYPTRTRHARVEREVVVFVLSFRAWNRAVRYVELYGNARGEFGPKVALWPINIDGRREDDLLQDAIQDAKNVMHALRNPVEVPVISDEEVAGAKAQPEPVQEPEEDSPGCMGTPAQPAVVDEIRRPRDPIAQLVREGRFVIAAPMNWRSKSGKMGSATFGAVIQRIPDGVEEKLFGSDIARAVAETSPKPGDIVRFMKFPKIGVKVGNRTVQKNIWTCDILEEASVDASHDAPH